MHIGDNSRNYDLNKQCNEIQSDEILSANDKDYKTIFDVLDSTKNKDGKLSKDEIVSIFKKLVTADTNKDKTLSNNELIALMNKLGIKVDINKFKSFIKKLLDTNEYKYINLKLGVANHNTRIIDAQNVAMRESLHGVVPQKNNYNSAINGEIDSFHQGQRGDCYLLAEINALKNTQNGRDIIKQNIKKNKDGSVTVTLPGAKIVKQNLIKDYPNQQNKILITGVYHITPQAISKASKLAGDTYSKGDLDVIVLELAMEAYRMEMAKTNTNLGIRNTEQQIGSAENASNSYNSNDILSGGFAYDAGFILTGKKSDVYRASRLKYNYAKPYTKGEYGFITREEMEQQCLLSEKRTSEINSYSSSELSLYKKLQMYAGKEDELALTASVRVSQKGDDGVTRAGGSHAITVVKITKSTVYILNPWMEDKKGNKCIEPIPMKEFIKMCTGLVAQECPNDKPNKPSGASQNINTNLINSALNFLKNKNV